MEQVILVDESGQQIGTADKAVVHHANTPLHLAFSCYLFNSRGEFLLTQRALSKVTWPGVWTNTCCGHPVPGESLRDTVKRRLRDELGLGVERVDLVLPRFRYHATMANGVTENEMCPVFRVIADQSPTPHPAEVEDISWVDWTEFTAMVLSDYVSVSPWCAEQVRELVALDPEPMNWKEADEENLPAASGQHTQGLSLS